MLPDLFLWAVHPRTDAGERRNAFRRLSEKLRADSPLLWAVSFMSSRNGSASLPEQLSSLSGVCFARGERATCGPP
jgi:hypothetical protein